MRLVRAVLLVLTLALVISGAALAATGSSTYTVTNLGSLGLGESFVSGINATGQVTGLSYLSTTYSVPCPPDYPGTKCTAHPYHAFQYSNGAMKDLGTLGGHNSQGSAINLSDQVAGWANTKSGGHDAALWNGKTTVDLGALGPLAGSYSIAYGINDSGQVVGSWGTNASSQPFLYSSGTVTGLPEPSAFTPAGCEARAINNKGQIAGMCTDSSGGAHLVVWQDGTVSDLGTIGNDNLADLEALSLNNNGQIAGWTANAGGFLYSNGTITHGFSANAINDNGVMVGGASIDNGGTVQNLNNLIPAGSGYQITNATAIDNNGQIAANTSNEAAVLLNPK